MRPDRLKEAFTLEALRHAFGEVEKRSLFAEGCS
jgi:hypothetical protein